MPEISSKKQNNTSLSEAFAALNEEQKQAVTQIEGPVMVLAGPGTGKTQIIALRIAQILQETQLDPHNILCLTFTESGVVAMRKRLLSIVGSAAYHVRIHTFHSFCNEVIKDWPEKFIFARELEPLTDVERILVMRGILDELSVNNPLKSFGDPYLYQRDCLRAIQDLKREDIAPEAFLNLLKGHEDAVHAHRLTLEAFVDIHGAKLTEQDVQNICSILGDTPFKGLLQDLPTDKKERTAWKNRLKKELTNFNKNHPKQVELATVYQRYQEELKKRGRYDYEDMILFAVQKFKEDKELLAHYQEQFQYILVDEYQDTNGAQNEVVQLLADYFENPNVFVVGDDKQSIYRFQGASLENILGFYQRYRESIKVISLKQNYRSQQLILDAAHGLIQHNEHDFTKWIPDLDRELLSAKSIPLQKLQIASLENPHHEHYFLAKQVEKLIQEGATPSEIAILYRYNWEARELMDLFLRMEIPFQLEAGVDVLQDKNIQKLIHLLKYIHDPEDEESLFHVLHFDFLGFRPLDIAKISRAAGMKRQSLFKYILREKLLEELDIAEPQNFRDFLSLCASWKAVSINKPFVEFFEIVIRESGYLDFIMSQPDKVEQLNRLNSLFDEFKTLNNAHHELKFKDVMEHLYLLQENRIAITEHTLRTQKDAVRLMTAHKSKGLEFDHVFVMNLVDKHWGNTRDRALLKLPTDLLSTDISPHERNEDERRLFYVAMTRAKQTLTLSTSEENLNGRPQVPCMFLDEIPAEIKEPLNTAHLEEEALQRFQTIFLELPTTPSLEEEEFARSCLQGYVMSVTHLNNYLKCPRYFYYNNLLRVPRAKNKFASFGTAVHESLKDLHIQHKKTEQVPEKDFLLKAFERHLKRQVLSEQDFRGGLELGRESLASYYDQAQFNAQVMPEYNFSSHGVNLDGIPLTGRLDKIELVGDKQVHVVDYKTGNPDTKSAALKPGGDYHRQIVFYQLLCDLSTQFPYQMVSGAIDFVQAGKKGHVEHRIKVGPQDLERLQMEIRDTYQDIQELAFLKYPERWCGECEWCDA